MPQIKITATIDVDDDEVDTGPHGPLTQKAYEDYIEPLYLDDVRLELVDGAE